AAHVRDERARETVHPRCWVDWTPSEGRCGVVTQCGGWRAGGDAPRVPRTTAGTRGTAGEQSRAGDGWQRRAPRTDQQAPVVTKISGRIQEDPSVGVVVSA